MAEFHLPPQWFYIYLRYILKIYIPVFTDFIVCVFCLHALLCITYMPRALQKQTGITSPVWSYGWLWTTVRVLGTEQRTPAIATAALNSRAISHLSSPQNSFNNCAFPHKFKLYQHLNFFCMCVSVHAHTCALACLSVYHVFADVYREQRGCWIPRNRSHRQLSGILCG